MKRSSTACVGIDFGTSNCCIAVWKNDKEIEIVPNDLGERETVSCISFNGAEILAGSAAANKATRNAENTIFDIHRLIGYDFNAPILQSDIGYWQFIVKQEKTFKTFKRPMICCTLNNDKQKEYFVEEILAMILSYIKDNVEEYIGIKVENAVISIPSMFHYHERQVQTI